MLTFQLNNKNNDINYLFIDGAYLERIIQKISKQFWSDGSLQVDFSKIGSPYHKVFYYNSLPGKRNAETEKEFQNRSLLKETFYNELKLLDKFHVYEGVTFGRKGKIRQKAVDIMIAVDMLRNSFRKNMTMATLLTGDLDFKPLLEALLLEGMHTTLLYSNESISNELLYSADRNQRITIKQIYEWMSDRSKEGILVPKYKSDFIQGSKEIIAEGHSLKENITLLKDDEYYWLKLWKDDRKTISSMSYGSKNQLIQYYEDINEVKIKWQ